MCMQYSVHHLAIDNIRADDRRIHGIWVFSPCCLRHRFPRMAVRNEKKQSEKLNNVHLISECLIKSSVVYRTNDGQERNQLYVSMKSHKYVMYWLHFITLLHGEEDFALSYNSRGKCVSVATIRLVKPRQLSQFRRIIYVILYY